MSWRNDLPRHTGLMTRWSAFTDWLDTADDTVHLSWPELQAIVGPLPPSASKHRAWWSGDRSQVRSWRTAGYRLSELALGEHVTLVRESQPSSVKSSSAEHVHPDPYSGLEPEGESRRDTPAKLLLVSCVKSKRQSPSAAKDLYTSPLFRKERDYAEASGIPWFILSAEYGLCRPDDWLTPYERYLPDTSAAYQRAWGLFAVERLDLIAGPIRGMTVEIHASAGYVNALGGALEQKGAKVLTPLAGLAMGERLQWYDHHLAAAPGRQTSSTERHRDTKRFVAALQQHESAIDPSAFLTERRTEWSSPGMYSWFVDDSGAAALARGLRHDIVPGLIYAGLAGATRWPSGGRSENTLWARIRTMHLGGNHNFSTFRLTLGSILAAADGAESIDEARLTDWMLAHLRVIAIPHDDPDTLGHLESEILGELDPPLNLQGRPKSEVRVRLKELRRHYK